MRSNILSEKIPIVKFLPATFTYLTQDLYYAIQYFTHNTCRGLTYISGSGTKDSIGDFVMLRNKGMVLTNLKTTPFILYK